MSEDEGVNLGPGKLFAADPATDTWKPLGIVTDGWTMYPDTPESAEAPEWLQSAIDRASADQTITLTTKVDTSGFDRMLDVMRTAVGAMEEFSQAARRVALMGTGYRRHASPGKRRSGETRAAHARRRRLYTERLQRDRRRRRAGRAPILRSSAFQALIPRAQLDPRKAGPEAAGMEIVLSLAVPDDQVYIVDNSLLDQFVQPFELEPPKLYERGESWADMQRYWRSTELFGRGYGRSHRATNFLIQADAPRRGHRPSRVWVDDVEVDVDRWMNEGGADRG